VKVTARQTIGARRPHRKEVGMGDAEIEPVGRHVRGRVEQHVVAVLVGQVDPFHRMLDTREVAPRREREAPVTVEPHDSCKARLFGRV
jgi:hypothetical protein